MATFLHCPHPQPFSLGRRESDLKVPLPSGERFRVRAMQAIARIFDIFS
jgi:hypothetical protein